MGESAVNKPVLMPVAATLLGIVTAFLGWRMTNPPTPIGETGPLGKYFVRGGIWIVVLWTTVLSALLFTLNPDTHAIIGIVHAVLSAILFALIGFFNRELWLESMPFFVIQATLGVVIFNSASV